MSSARLPYHLERQLQPTPRQLEILREIAYGKQNKTIAHERNLSVQTIRNHLTDLYRRLGASGRAHAVTLAIQRGLIKVN